MPGTRRQGVLVGGLVGLIASCAPALAAPGAVTAFGPSLGNGDSLGAPRHIANAPDGNLAFVDATTGFIEEITPTGAITSTRFRSTPAPMALAAGADGRLWFGGRSGNGHGGVGYLVGTNGSAAFYSVGGGDVAAIAAGVDGSMWFAQDGAVGKIASGSAAPVTYTGSGDNAISTVTDITPGPDGNMWFTEYSLNMLSGVAVGAIARITPSGTITTYRGDIAHPASITQGPDGNLWFTDAGRFTIGRITPAGVITLFGTDAAGQPITRPTGIAAGPDGNLWFTMAGASGHAAGEITPAGVITQFGARGSTPPVGIEIVAGPDGGVWTTDDVNHQVDRLATEAVTPASGNLLIGGAAENSPHPLADPGLSPAIGWATTPNFTVEPYGLGSFPSTSIAGSIGGGQNFFAGGPRTAASHAYELLDLTGQAAGIDDNRASVVLSGALGGSNDDDNATVSAIFEDAAGAPVGTPLKIGPVKLADHGGAVGFAARDAAGAVPVGTRHVLVQVDTERVSGTFDNAYLDNLVLDLKVADKPAGPADPGNPGNPGRPGAGPAISFKRLARLITVPATGRFSVKFDATPDSRGVALLQRKGKPRPVRLGSKRFHAPAGGRVKVTYALSARNRARLVVARKFKARLVVTVGGKQFVAALTLEPAKPRRH
jgi:streptogramin lyase